MAMWENCISSLCSDIVRITDGDEFSWFLLMWVSRADSNAHKNVIFNETIGSDAYILSAQYTPSHPSVQPLISYCEGPILRLYWSRGVCGGMYTLSQALVGQRGESLVLTVEECVSTPVHILTSNK